MATSGASLGAAVVSAGALPGASSLSEEAPPYYPVSDTTLGAIRAQQFVSSAGVNLTPAASSGPVTDATTHLESQVRRASGDRLSFLGATTVQGALFAAAPSAATGASTSHVVGGRVAQQRDQARVTVARADEAARNDAGAASMQPRCSLEAASMQPRCSLDEASMQPRFSLYAASMQPRSRLYAAAMPPCDAASMQPQCRLVMQPRCSLDAASMQPQCSLYAAL